MKETKGTTKTTKTKQVHMASSGSSGKDRARGDDDRRRLAVLEQNAKAAEQRLQAALQDLGVSAEAREGDTSRPPGGAGTLHGGGEGHDDAWRRVNTARREVELAEAAVSMAILQPRRPHRHPEEGVGGEDRTARVAVPAISHLDKIAAALLGKDARAAAATAAATAAAAAAAAAASGPTTGAAQVISAARAVERAAEVEAVLHNLDSLQSPSRPALLLLWVATDRMAMNNGRKTTQSRMDKDASVLSHAARIFAATVVSASSPALAQTAIGAVSAAQQLDAARASHWRDISHLSK